MASTTISAQAIAKISYDDSITGLTQPYVVTSGRDEVFRHATYAGCDRFIIWHGYVLQDEQAMPAAVNYAQAEFEQHIEEQAALASKIEIDSTDDAFGALYRVWGGEKGINLLGTFYQSLEGCWISQPCNTTQRGSWSSDSQAIASILSA